MKKINLSASGKIKYPAQTSVLLVFIFVGAVQIFAQPQLRNDSPAVYGNQNSDDIKIVESGILNDQAVYLSQPVYPSKAKAANIAGDVNVEVLVNQKGIVIKAKAVSGHELLRKAAEWAARRTKFRPSKINGEIVHIKGIIVYTFP